MWKTAKEPPSSSPLDAQCWGWNQIRNEGYQKVGSLEVRRISDLLDLQEEESAIYLIFTNRYRDKPPFQTVGRGGLTGSSVLKNSWTLGSFRCWPKARGRQISFSICSDAMLAKYASLLPINMKYSASSWELAFLQWSIDLVLHQASMYATQHWKTII